MSELFPAQPANPSLTPEVVAALVAEHWGLRGTLRPLGSMEDQNLRLRADDGRTAVVKISGRHTPAESLDLQNAALRHLAARRDGFTSPEPIPSPDGHETVEASGYRVRLLSWVEGIPISERAYLGAADLRALGALAARVCRALDGFDHPGLAAANTWDVRQAALALDESRDYLPTAWQPYLDAAIGAFELVGVDAPLPSAIVHGDLTPVNAVCLPGDELRSVPIGVIDFGDVMRSWRVGDVAATAVGAVEHPGTGDTLAAVLAVLEGYHAVLPLTETEIDALWPLVVARAAVTAAISHRQLAGNADNDYAQQSADSGARAMRRIAAVPPALALAATRAAVGLPAVPGAARALATLATRPRVDVLPAPYARRARRIDLSADSDVFTAGQWADPAALAQLVDAAGPVFAAWGEARLQPEPVFRAPETLELGADLFAPVGTAVHAPWDATSRPCPAGQVLLDLGDNVLLRLSGLSRLSRGVLDGPVTAGDVVGRVGESPDSLPARVRVQLLTGGDTLPHTGVALHRDVWTQLCPDPSVAVGCDVSAPPPVDAEARRRAREAVVATPQHLYYDAPPAIVRGWRHHLFDADGRCYLDMINNIAAVGHSHPRVTQAALRQFRRLNTNSRFLYDSMTRYAERMAALLPDGLDAVFLVNSGSEAADLALQLARRYTGRHDVVALAGAYHGWTGSVIDISTSPVDRPNWRAELPGWVHVADQPDLYRGGPDTGQYRASVRAACAEADGGPAAFVSEPLLGNQGALELPPGYLAGVYEDVRAAGGVCVADEVQVGMARTGVTFWAFEHENAVPDIVYTAKATGNGHPLGVVVCRREIADAFDGQTSYFSSTGGGPVSCEIGLAVLDVLRDEGLQENARVVGAHLKQELTALAGRHPLVGAVHGRGLYLGIDLVLDRERRTPARFEALAVSERLRSLGVVMQPTGDAFNVLKVKPPLTLDRAGADYFVAALDRVLTEFT